MITLGAFNLLAALLFTTFPGEGTCSQPSANPCFSAPDIAGHVKFCAAFATRLCILSASMVDPAASKEGWHQQRHAS